MEVAFEIDEVGEISVPEPVQAVGMENIRALMLADDTPVSDIMKLIALEIVEVMTKMASPSSDVLKRSQKEMNDQIKGLRELQKTLTEAEIFSKRDSLNMDGPKFQFVFTALVKMFQDAQKDAGMDDEQVNSVMAHFRDKIANDEERIKRDLKKMEGIK